MAGLSFVRQLEIFLFEITFFWFYFEWNQECSPIKVLKFYTTIYYEPNLKLILLLFSLIKVVRTFKLKILEDN